ncbi:hypothetical protein RBB77_00565 [Tunturibacter psychrotolerans]|uniref:VWA domain-containing protein n=1 Tax=Tunturiibacter psychrotolerans TaxID=3069686 RepID=A0AAU7ZR33_9BACT
MQAGVFWLIGFWVLGSPSIWGQGASVALAPASGEAHIAVQVRDTSGEPVRRLEARNFEVKLVAGGISTVTQVKVEGVRDRRSRGSAGVPTKLLLVLLTSDAEVVRQLPDKLDALWKANWRVSVLDAGGIQTPYVSSSSQLKLELAHKGQTHRSINLATARLTRFTGRRVVFLVTQPGVQLSDFQRAVALLPGISVYHVGGDPWKQVYAAGAYDAGSSFISATSSNDAVSSVAGGSGAPVFQRVRGRETEDRTLGGAIRDALRDGYGYYDLTVTMPVDVPRLEMAVDISVPGESYSIYAQPYVTQGRAPQLSLVRAKR